MILPERVLGSPGAHCSQSGVAIAPISLRTQATSSLRSASLGCSPDGLARYAILRIDDDGGYEVEHRAAAYDPSDVYVQFEARDVPAREKILSIFFRRR